MTMDIDKDDEATREMLEMMGALPDDVETDDDLLATLDAIENSTDKDDVTAEVDEGLDELLNGLEDIETPEDTSKQGQQLQAALAGETLEDNIEPDIETDIDTDEINLDDFDLDDLGDFETPEEPADTDNLNETVTEETVNIDTAEQASIEQDDLEMLDELANFDGAESATDETQAEQTETAEFLADDLDGMNELTDPAEVEVEPISTDTSENLSQANQVIETMQESIGIDNETRDIAEKCSTTAKQATALALEVSEQAQSSTEKLQQTIQATFDATEKAFDALKEAKYEVDTDALNTNISASEIADKMTKIREKNQKLKTINAAFMTKINELN